MSKSSNHDQLLEITTKLRWYVLRGISHETPSEQTLLSLSAGENACSGLNITFAGCIDGSDTQFCDSVAMIDKPATESDRLACQPYYTQGGTNEICETYFTSQNNQNDIHWTYECLNMADCVGAFNTHTPLQQCTNQLTICPPEEQCITLPECQSESMVTETCLVSRIDECNRGCGTGARCNMPIGYSHLNITSFDCIFPVESGASCNVSCLYDLVANDVYRCDLGVHYLPDCVAPPPPTTTTAPTTTTETATTTTSSNDDNPMTSAPSTPETIDPFNVIVDLVNMDDTFVSERVHSVLEAISNGVCAALGSIDSNALCTGVRLKQTETRRRRSLAVGEWTAIIEVTVSSGSNRDTSFAYFNDDENSLTVSITISLQNDGLDNAIASGSTLKSESFALNINYDDYDDDDGDESEIVIILYTLPLDVQDADSLADNPPTPRSPIAKGTQNGHVEFILSQLGLP